MIGRPNDVVVRWCLMFDAFYEDIMCIKAMIFIFTTDG